MTLQELKTTIKKGKYYNWGKIPGWRGYIKYNYFLDQLYYIDNNIEFSEKELEDKLKNRNDLYYII